MELSVDLGEANDPSAPLIAYAEGEIPQPQSQPAAEKAPEQQQHHQKLVEVAAPATLPAGYGFDAVFGGRTFRVIVPAGGVVKGERFTVECRPDANISVDDGGAPRGRWKDGLCDCCSLGCCHPSLLNACLCPQIMVAQVMTRMGLDWLARPAEGGKRWRRTFRRVAYILAAYIVARCLLHPYVRTRYEVAKDGTVVPFGPLGPPQLVVLCNIIQIAFSLYTFLIIARTRRNVRMAYGIPARSCGRCEDLCCSYWCILCVLAQMARHTADYRGRRAKCCSATGLKDGANHGSASMV